MTNPDRNSFVTNGYAAGRVSQANEPDAGGRRALDVLGAKLPVVK